MDNPNNLIDDGKSQPFDNSFSCRECQAGQMRRRFVTYFTWLGEELITVPDFPAWVCDVCGRREYDPRALNHLSLLLSPNAGKANNNHPPTENNHQTGKKSASHP